MTPPHGERPSACGQAALYVLGSLAETEAKRFEAHAGRCPECASELEAMRRVVGDLARTVEPVPPPTRLRERILAAARSRTAPAEAESPDAAASATSATSGPVPQVWRHWPTSSPDASVVVKAESGEWHELGDSGVRVKPLFVDPIEHMVTMLVRMDPGTRYPAHRHGGGEECYVITGDLAVGDRRLGPGDYQYSPDGSVHPIQATDGGCLLLIRSSQHDELLAHTAGDS
jgi:anti-sigma factor ChrR (cupin superfamily)